MWGGIVGNNIKHAAGAVGSNLQAAANTVENKMRFAGDALTGKLTGEQVGDALTNIPGLHNLPIAAMEKVTGKDKKQLFMEGVVQEKGDPRSGQYDIVLPPMPF